MPPRRRRWAAVALLSVASGCGSSSGGTGPDPVVKGTITVNLTPASVTIAPGGVGSLGVSVTRGGGFDGAVTLSASGVPAGVSLTFGSTVVSAVAVSTSINLTVAPGTPVGTSDINIVGSGTGVTSPASKLTLRVQ